MSLFIDLKFVDSISHQLRNFRKTKDYVWNFSCPICGDSKKVRSKARGFFLRPTEGDTDHLIFKCHNEGCIASFADVLKFLDQSVFEEYLLEKFQEKGGAVQKAKAVKPKAPKQYTPPKPLALVGCPSIATLGPEHPARQYIEGRKIPEKFFTQLFWADDFAALAQKVCPTGDPLRKEGRIVIPFLDRERRLLAVQGRSLEPDAEVRYITIKSSEEATKIYGMERLGLAWKRIYLVEGPLDSLFLDNCLAMAGSDIPKALPIEKVLVIYDNEPKKTDTIVKIEKAIAKGYRVCIWPSTIQQKDLNQMVIEGIKASSLRTIIDQNSYVGLQATAKLVDWRRDNKAVTQSKGVNAIEPQKGK